MTRSLLRKRVRAWAARSRSEWLAGVEGVELRTRQDQIFDRMTALGVGRLALTGVTRPGSPKSVTATVARFTYRLTGYDSADRTFEVKVSVKLPCEGQGARLTGWAPAGRPELWDVDDLIVRRDPLALVVSAGPPERADEVLVRARRAYGQVSQVWGSARPAVWVAPGTNVVAARLLGTDPTHADDPPHPSDPDDPGADPDPATVQGSVSAVTEGPLRPGRVAGADRVFVLPTAWESLSGTGRQVLMTHELTHVVARATTTGPVPLWLSEGLAELTAYRLVNLPEKAVVNPALRSARTTTVRPFPPDLPVDADFAPGSVQYGPAYGWSLLTARAIADEHGVAGLVRLYRVVAGTPGAGSGATRQPARPSRTLDQAMASELNTDRPALTRRLQARAALLLS